MDFDFSKVSTPKESEIDILDAKGDKAGLRLKLAPKTSERYQKVFRWAVDQHSSHKKVSKQRKKEIQERLFSAQVSGWEFFGPLEEYKKTPFNPANLHNVLYEQGDFSAMVRNQITEAVDDEENFTPQE